MAGITQNKQKALLSLWSINKNCRNVVVSRGQKSNNNNNDDSNKTSKNNNKVITLPSGANSKIHSSSMNNYH